MAMDSVEGIESMEGIEGVEGVDSIGSIQSIVNMAREPYVLWKKVTRVWRLTPHLKFEVQYGLS